MENNIAVNENSNSVVNSTPTEVLPVIVVAVARPTVKSIDADTLNVTLTLSNGQVVVASPFRWGRKMLMKVDGDLTRGERVSIGQIAKRALTAAGLVLPPAELKRPRKAKVAAVSVVAVATASDESTDLTRVTAPEVGVVDTENLTSDSCLNDLLDELLDVTAE